MAESVVFVAGNYIIEDSGGHPSYVRAHAYAARRAGFEPHLFSLERVAGTRVTDFGIVHQIPVHFDVRKIRVLSHRKSQLVWRYATLARAVASYILEHQKVRLIHSFGLFGAAGIMARDILHRYGIDVVPVLSSYDTITHEGTAKVRGLRAEHGYVQRLIYQTELVWARTVVAHYEQRGHLESRLVLVNYDSVRKLLESTYGIGYKIRKLSYSSEAAFRQSLSPHEDVPTALALASAHNRPLVISVSRHDARKGVDIFLHALARLKHAGRRFHACLVGGGALLARHRRLAEQLGVGDVTVIVGEVSDPRPYLERANIFVLPSLEEGSGSLALIEALEAGVACIASNIDGIPEDVTDEESALIVPPGDIAGLAGAIGRLLNDTTLRNQIAQGGRRVFENRFSPDAFAKALCQTYRELLF